MKLLRMFLVLFVLGATPFSGREITFLIQVRPAAAQTQPDVFDWDSYDRLLRIYTDGRGLVNYRRLADDRELLDNATADLGAVSVRRFNSWSDGGRMAFLINAYNLLTIRAVADHYPIRRRPLVGLLYPANSIRQIPGVWDKLKFQLLGRDVTLDQIEHDLLLKPFGEPRAHMALVCASLSCPGLRGEPYHGGRLESQLDDQARSFLADSGRCLIDPEKKKISLSPIFDWYGEDFLARYASQAQVAGLSAIQVAVLNFVSRYVSPENQRFINAGGYQLDYLDYDWTLNELGEP